MTSPPGRGWAPSTLRLQSLSCKTANSPDSRDDETASAILRTLHEVGLVEASRLDQLEQVARRAADHRPSEHVIEHTLVRVALERGDDQDASGREPVV